MTQPPFGGTAPPSVETGGSLGDHRHPGPDAKQDTTVVPGSGDFGATTISGSPRNQGYTDNRRPTPSLGDQRQRVPMPQSVRSVRARGPRRARLQLRHISPLTVLKFSCVLSIALFFIWLIMVGVLYGVLDASNVISNINNVFIQLNNVPGYKPPITAGVIFGGAAIIGVVNIVLFVALTTIGSVIYNLCSDLVGGIEITLSER